jgi:hypothetical protein
MRARKSVVAGESFGFEQGRSGAGRISIKKYRWWEKAYG